MTDTDTVTEQLLRVDPGTLIIADNIRKTVKLDPGFISSIKQHGVRVPIEVEPGENGSWIVIDGQLRTLAAIDAGRADVPIVTTGTREAAARITEQLIINDHRSGVTDFDRSAAYQALFELGVPASTIAKRTNTPIKRVTTALAVAGSKVASEALVDGNITLDQAAAIVEFEDTPALAEALASTALKEPAQFNHVLARAQQQRDSDQKKATLIEQLGFEGYTITEDFAASASVANATAMAINYLYTDEKLTTRLATTGTERLKPFEGLKAILIENYVWDGEARVSKWQAYFIVDGWQDLGYFAHEHMYKSGSGSAPGGGLTEDEKAKRKETRENNKLWAPATEVRRAWLTELLQRKELPAGWEMFVAQYVARANVENNYSFALKLLGGGTGGVKWLADNPTRAAHFLIAHAIASVEDRYEFGKSGWRESLAPAYMRQLSKWGYTMSDLEESVSKGSGK